jgi:membrane protease YdiL (CAAX protease family)
MSEEPTEFARTCPHCGAESPPEFPVCWRCQGDLPPVAMAVAPAHDGIDEEAAADPSMRAARRKRIAFEVAAVVAVVWLPLFASRFLFAGDPRPQDLAATTLWLLQGLGILVLVAFLAWLDGDWRRFLGLRPPRVSDLAWGAGTFVAMHLGAFLAYLVAFALGVEPVEEQWQPHEPSAAWIAPLDFLVWALVEEVLFRAYLWSRLRELSGRPLLSIVVVAAMFSAYHGYGLEGSLAVFASGLVLGVVFAARRSLWPVVLAHWAVNMVLVST